MSAVRDTRSIAGLGLVRGRTKCQFDGEWRKKREHSENRERDNHTVVLARRLVRHLAQLPCRTLFVNRRAA